MLLSIVTATYNRVNLLKKNYLFLKSKKKLFKFEWVIIYERKDQKTKKFFEKPFYKLWENNAKLLSNKYDIQYLDTKEILRSKINIINSDLDYFCYKPGGDNVHQTYEGNLLTAKIIYNVIFAD